MTTDETDLEKGIMGGSHWVKRWAEGDISEFYKTATEPLFETYEDRMFGDRQRRIFVPLCGKSPDLIWMYEKGHTVVGVDIAEQPCRELFEDNSIEYDLELLDDVKLYKSKDGRLQLYAANLFALTEETLGTFDMIWDSRSLISINKQDRKSYSRLMTDVLVPRGEIFIKVMEYDESVWPGPPHSIGPAQIRDIYGAAWAVELIQEKSRPRPTVTSPDTPSCVEAENCDGAPSPPCQPQKPSTLGEAMKAASYIMDRFFVITKT